MGSKLSFPLTNVQVVDNSAGTGQQFVPFAALAVPSGGTANADCYVDFDGRVPIRFTLAADEWREKLKLSPPAGELVVPVIKPEAEFDTIAGGCGGAAVDSGARAWRARAREVGTAWSRGCFVVPRGVTGRWGYAVNA